MRIIFGAALLLILVQLHASAQSTVTDVEKKADLQKIRSLVEFGRPPCDRTIREQIAQFANGENYSCLGVRTVNIYSPEEPVLELPDDRPPGLKVIVQVAFPPPSLRKEPIYGLNFSYPLIAASEHAIDISSVNLVLSVDDEEIAIKGNLIGDPEWRSGKITACGSAHFELTSRQIIKLAGARTITFQFGAYSGKLPPETLQAIRDLAGFR